MAFPAPVLKPPLPPLKPPPVPPYRIPPILRDPPTETQPEIDIPNKPPTQTDLLGIVCIYSNRPIFTPKKIRYKYPGQEWQEIAGDRFSTELIQRFNTIQGISYRVIWRSWSPPLGRYGSPSSVDPALGIVVGIQNINGNAFMVVNSGNQLISLGLTWPQITGNGAADPIIERIETLSGQIVDTITECVFRVFNNSNQVILNITNSNCPEVETISAKCEYKQENEKLVKKWIVGFFQNLRVEYQSNCATVWLDSPPFFPTQVYKECSDPECPPPRIRFDKKCEEPCQKCPPGTVTRVLNGRSLLCVDGRGCLIKTIKFDSKCESYDCVC